MLSSYQKLILGLLAAGITALPGTAFAATLYLSPASGSYGLGSTFRVSVVAYSPDQAMNAANAIVDFPADKLAVVAVSKASSILTYWVADPTFSNAAGTVSFQGIATNPGYTGRSGVLATITFKVLSLGSAAVTIEPSSQVLANDGNGTDILTGESPANYRLLATTPTPAASRATGGDKTPPGPFSITFPEGNPTADPLPQASFVATDAGSGIDHYEYSIDASPFIRIASGVTTTPFVLPSQSLGQHTLAVRAVDKAGNATLEQVSFTIAPLTAPAIVKYPESIAADTPFEVDGTSAYPGATVTIVIHDAAGAALATKDVVAGENGAFSAVFQGSFAAGSYSITASLADKRGAKSADSAPALFQVTTDILGIAWIALNALTVIVVFGLVFYGLYHGLVALSAWRARRRQEAYLRHIREEIATMDAHLGRLDRDLERYVKFLQRIQSVRSLTEEELALMQVYEDHMALAAMHTGMVAMDSATGVKPHAHVVREDAPVIKV